MFHHCSASRQGYNISVINGVVDLNKGKETTVVGTLKPRGGCSHTSGLDTAFIDFNNKNLAIGTDVDELSECEAITTDGFYGIQVLTTITLFSIDNHYKTSLSLEYTQGYSSLGQCQAEHPKK